MTDFNRFLVKTLGIKQEDTAKFKMLFFHSFAVGLFIAFYFVQANSVFIKTYGGETLPYAYMAAGLVGYIISSLYSFFQKKIRSQYLFGSALAFMLIVTIAGRMLHSFIDDKYLSFFVFVWAWPFISLAGIQSGGLALKLLNLTQVKRMFGLINMGGVSASILGYLIIPIISRNIGVSYNMLLIAAVSLAASIVLLYYIYKKFPDKTPMKHVARNDEKTTIRHLIKEKYFRLIFIAATLSMTVIYVADFGFLSAIKNLESTLFAKEGAVAGYLALVYAGLKVGELFISYFSGRILSKYGVKLGLTVMPIALTGVILISLAVGFTAGAVSIAFLALMTLSKSLERILRRGLDDPAFNILYQPLPAAQQLNVQSKVGVVMQFAIAIAGLLLFGVSSILKVGSGFKLEYFPLFFLPILGAWVFVAWKLYLAYKNKLREVLRELSKQQTRESSKYQYGIEVLTKKFKKFNENVISLSVTILSETSPRTFEPYIQQLLTQENTLIQKAVLRSIDPTWRTRIVKQISAVKAVATDDEIFMLAEKAESFLNFSEVKNITETDVPRLIESDSRADKILLLKYLIENKTIKEPESILLHLLEYDNKVVKSAAIRVAVTYKTDKSIEHLVQFIKAPAYYHISSAAILDIGERCLPFLQKLYDETDDDLIKLKLIEIYAKMGSTPAKSLIVKQLNAPSRKIQLAAAWALFYCKYQAPEDEQELIKAKILDVTANLLWLMLAVNEMEEQKSTLKLFLALDQERANNLENLFNLMSFIHDPRVISLIKKNIIGKNTIYAIELIDNFVMPELKPYIVPIFDDITVNQRIKTLSKFFPVKRLGFQKTLDAIIMRDFDKIDTWTVTKALEMIEKNHRLNEQKADLTKEIDNYEDIKLWKQENLKPALNRIRHSELPDEVFLCLFHTNELVYSTAAKIIFDENPVKCADYLKNMNSDKKQLLKTLRLGGELPADKLKQLKKFQLFFGMPDDLLASLAEIVTPVEVDKGDELLFSENGNQYLYMLVSGSLVYSEGKPNEIVFSKRLIITPGMNIEQQAKSLSVKRKAYVLKVDRNRYFNLLVDNTEMLQHIFDAISK